MDQNQHGEATREVGPPAHTNPPTQTAGPSNPSFYSREQQYVPPQYMYQLQQNQLQQQLDNVWAKQYKEIEETTNFKTHSLPLAKIKKIMKFDEDVRMISAEAPIVFAKACEMFIQDLTTRAWANADNNNRRTLKKMDITSAISKTDVFDFLLDIDLNDDIAEHQVFAGIPAGMSTTPIESAPRMSMGRPVVDQINHGLENHPFPSPMGPIPNHQNHSSSSDK